MERYKDIAPCGIDCFNCEVYAPNITEAVATQLSTRLGITPEKVPCSGCRGSDGCRLHMGECATLECVKARNVDYCFQCEDFPCEFLSPAADGADRFPHNLKLYNLCRMKLKGIEAWRAEAAENRRRYFKGKFTIGRGPVL